MLEVYALVEERLEEFLLYVTPVSKDLTEEVLRENAPHPLIPVVNVSRCETATL